MLIPYLIIGAIVWLVATQIILRYIDDEALYEIDIEDYIMATVMGLVISVCWPVFVPFGLIVIGFRYLHQKLKNL